VITARAGLLTSSMVAVTVLAGCGGGARPAADETGAAPTAAATSDLEVGDETRSYRLYRPANAEAQPALVLVLHGGGGTSLQAERTYGWNDLADQEGFLVAYPDGRGRTWNSGGGCCGRAAADDVDDVGFLLALIDDLVTAERVDPARVYATGMSNGAMMSYALACSTDVLAAIAPVAGTMLADCTAPAPVSVLHIHGLADSSVRFDGRPGDGVAEIDGPPIPSVIEHWRTVGACTPPSVTTVGAVQHSIAYCAEGREVALTTVEGAGHQWPGAESPRRAADPASTELDATETIWRFFEANPHP
jgi:polyhydroxybutyrate depolymerase